MSSGWQPWRSRSFRGPFGVVGLGVLRRGGNTAARRGRRYGRIGGRAFTTDRLDAVQLIAGQLAVSLDNAQLYAELSASRARIVATADQTRRRIERDLHDGAQQRLVSLILQLRVAQAAAPPAAGAYFTTSQLFSQYVTTDRHFDPSAGGLLSALILLVGIRGSMLGGHLADRSTNLQMFVVGPLVTVAALLALIPVAPNILLWPLWIGIGFFLIFGSDSHGEHRKPNVVIKGIYDNKRYIWYWHLIGRPGFSLNLWVTVLASFVSDCWLMRSWPRLAAWRCRCGF